MAAGGKGEPQRSVHLPVFYTKVGRWFTLWLPHGPGDMCFSKEMSGGFAFLGFLLTLGVYYKVRACASLCYVVLHFVVLC